MTCLTRTSHSCITHARGSQIKRPDSSEEPPDFTRLAEVSGMAPVTIRDAFRQMLPYFATVRERESVRAC